MAVDAWRGDPASCNLPDLLFWCFVFLRLAVSSFPDCFQTVAAPGKLPTDRFPAVIVPDIISTHKKSPTLLHVVCARRVGSSVKSCSQLRVLRSQSQWFLATSALQHGVSSKRMSPLELLAKRTTPRERRRSTLSWRKSQLQAWRWPRTCGHRSPPSPLRRTPCTSSTATGNWHLHLYFYSLLLKLVQFQILRLKVCVLVGCRLDILAMGKILDNSITRSIRNCGTR